MYWRYLIFLKLLYGFFVSWSFFFFKNYKIVVYWMFVFVEFYNKIFRIKFKIWIVNFLLMFVYFFVFKDIVMKICYLLFNIYYDFCVIKLVGEII